MLCERRGTYEAYYDVKAGEVEARLVQRVDIPVGSLVYGRCGHTNGTLFAFIVQNGKLLLWLRGKVWPVSELALETSVVPDKRLRHRIFHRDATVMDLYEGPDDADVPGDFLVPTWESDLHFLCRLLRSRQSVEVIESVFPQEVRAAP